MDRSPPPVDLIRKRVVTDINTNEVLLDETIDQTDPGLDWVRPLPGVEGTRKTRDIEVVLWYLSRGPRRLDERLPPPDRAALMPRPTVEEVRGGAGNC